MLGISMPVDHIALRFEKVVCDLICDASPKQCAVILG